MGAEASLLDIEEAEALLRYLREGGWIGRHERVRVEVLAGGVSNKTVLVERESGAGWVLKQALPKLRVAVDWFSDPARIGREAEGLRWLQSVLPAGSAPGFVFEDRGQFLLCMEAVARPHENWKAMLLGGRVEAEHVEQFGGLLGRIHRIGAEQREQTAKAFGDRTFFETLRVEPYYQYTAQQVPEARGFLSRLVEQTRGRARTVVHGDYSPKNILVREGRLVLLDHEVIHFGDPGFDLGFAMTHLLSKAHHLPEHRRLFLNAAEAFWSAYRSELGEPAWAGELERSAVEHTLGCLMARVAGRSPLEYLNGPEKQRQKRAVMELMQRPPERLGNLVAEFAARI